MERSNWGRKPGQERILGIRITRAGWEEALSQAVLTHPEKDVYRSPAEWRQEFARSAVRVQWDPERSLRGGSLEYRSIQVGQSRHIVQRYVDECTVSITDLTPLVRQVDALVRSGNTSRASAQLPRARPYSPP